MLYVKTYGNFGTEVGAMRNEKENFLKSEKLLLTADAGFGKDCSDLETSSHNLVHLLVLIVHLAVRDT
jgi:hypothetical protein